MPFKSMLRVGASLLAVTTVFVSSAVFAQSTGTQEVEEVFVTAKKRDQTIGGNIVAVQVPKARSTITQEYLETQTAGQTFAQSLNLVPGVNFTNNDPYGSSGGNIRIRSYDNNRIALLEDGMPINDAGNYALFFNQQLDPEIVDHLDVNLGTSDVDAPTAAATGGTINVITKKPSDTFGGLATFGVGSFNYYRASGELDSGEIGNSGLSSFLTGSYQRYDKYRGVGNLEKAQYNARLFKKFNGDDFISVAAHFNRNRNDSYRALTRQQVSAYGFNYDYLSACRRDTPGAGTQNDGQTPVNAAASLAAGYVQANDNPANPSSCTNYQGLRVNPSDTGNVRMQSKFSLTDKVALTIDPSFQYVLANGGGSQLVAENDPRILAGNGGVGLDLNGDGDTADTSAGGNVNNTGIRVYTPSNTNTRRWGVNTSLIWTVAPSHLVRFAYTFDYALHRQTGQMARINPFGDPGNVFGGLISDISLADGSDLRTRDRRSIAKLNQLAFNYSGKYLDDKLHVDIGVRMPFFQRDLTQYCFTANTTSGFYGANQGQWCQSNAVVTSVDAQGLVTLAGNGAQKFSRPYAATKHYNKMLPNFGVSYKLADSHLFYFSYAEQIALPRTDNLYNLQVQIVAPETTKDYDLGYRYQSGNILTSVNVWQSFFKNRIVSSYDPDTNINVDRNVGDVNIWGVDAEMGARPFKGMSLYGSASYNHSTLKSNIVLANGASQTILATKGNALVETPSWTFGGRAEYQISGVTIGLQGKYVTQRYATDVNDEKAPAYAVFDGNVRYGFDQFGWSGAFVQLNVSNLFDRHYLGSISSSNTAGATTPTYQLGAPRTVQFSIHAPF